VLSWLWTCALCWDTTRACIYERPDMSGKLHQAVEKLGRLPVILPWRRRKFSQRFQDGHAVGCCLGIFQNWEQAASAAPETRPLGYDHVAGSLMYRDRLVTIYPSDYPMMLWLQKALFEGVRKVFDLGGHIGLSYYAYQKVLQLPADLSWVVHDVPAVMQAGRQEAVQLDPMHRLSFSDDFLDAAQADLLFTSGCLQYLQETLAQRLGALPRRPQWVLVNLLPLHEEHEFWTVQSIGTAFCPYRIQQAHTFFADMSHLGYQPLDTWENLEKSCWIAFDPEHSLDRYHGVAFQLNAAS
jgi:putative methyltransferase (TIGR04325 family)